MCGSVDYPTYRKGKAGEWRSFVDVSGEIRLLRRSNRYANRLNYNFLQTAVRGVIWSECECVVILTMKAKYFAEIAVVI